MSNATEFKTSVGVVVSSCDAFFDAWQPFNAFLRKFWPDCPLEIFLITNELKIQSDRIRSLPVGPDRGWSSNLLAALDRFPFPHLLYLQEDYLLTAPVDESQIGRDFAESMAIGADSLCFRARLKPTPGFQPVNDRFGVVPLNSDGRTRCQVTLWRKESLRSILRAGETAWNFEARGSARTQSMKILSYTVRENTPIPYLMSAISRGLWTEEAIDLCREHDVKIGGSFRPVSSQHSWQRRLRRAIGRFRLHRALAKQKPHPVELP